MTVDTSYRSPEIVEVTIIVQFDTLLERMTVGKSFLGTVFYNHIDHRQSGRERNMENT